MSKRYASLIQAEILSCIIITDYHMVFLLQPLFCLGTFRESEFRSTEINGEVKSSIDPPLEPMVLLNPAITRKNTILLLSSAACERFLSQ